MSNHSSGLPNWSFSLGPPGIQGRIRAQLEDFRVQEIPQVMPSGEGNHLWLEVEKRGANTHWVADQLARAAGIPSRDVGYAGLKDRHGVTTQWFSVALQEIRNPDYENWLIPDVVFLQVVNHNRKLKRGTLKGNRFQIVVRDLEGDLPELEDRLGKITRTGVPNYFGPQRFGHNGSNISRGMQWLRHGGRIARNKRSIYLSSLRSFLFNEVLARRIRQGNWDRLLDGDIAMLDGSQSVFPCVLPDSELTSRCETFDIHPTGPLSGSGGMQPEREALEQEQQALDEHSVMIDALLEAGSRSSRRSLRLVPEDLQYELNGDTLNLAFTLPAGNYATSLLRELVTGPDDVHIAES